MPKQPTKASNRLLEAQVKHKVRRVLEERRAYWHMPIPPGNMNTVDFLACVPVRITEAMVGHTLGAFVAIETKREGKHTVTSKQAETMRQVRAAGGVALMANVADEDWINNYINWAVRTKFKREE